MQTLRDKKIHLETYGCTFNFADTEKIARIALRQGCTIVPAEEAEAVVINTCTVVEKTERAMIKAISSYPDKEIYVTGCMPVAQPELIMKVRPDARMLHPDEVHACSDTIGALLDKGTGVVQACSGCPGNCAYCITKVARGGLTSFPEERVVAEVERLASLGTVEIQLTGQDLGAYGMDTGGSLAGLLKRIDSADGDFTVRVGMMNPATVFPRADDIADALCGEKIFSFAHLPVQSGSDSVLETMKRGYTGGDFIDIVSKFRNKIPEIRISTDIIAGYPTETAEDFRKTIDLLKKTRPTKINITRFSMRSGTAAAALRDLPNHEKKERSRALSRTATGIYDSEYANFIGKEVDVVVTEKKKPGTSVARDRFYNNIVIQEDLETGTRCRVRIVSHRRYYMIGRIMT